MGRKRWIAGLALCAGLLGSEDATAETPDTTTIRLLLENTAGVPNDMLDRAQREVTLLFKRAGIPLEWIDGEACLARCLTIRIISKPIGRKSRDPRVLAVTSGTRELRGRFAWIFYDRIQAGSRELTLELAQLLGLVMAHEMGHLLLPYGAHSLAGIMRPEWDRAQVKNATEGLLTFTPDQAALIRARLQNVSGTAAR